MLMRPLITPIARKACQQAASASRNSDDACGRAGARAKFITDIRSCFPQIHSDAGRAQPKASGRSQLENTWAAKQSGDVTTVAGIQRLILGIAPQNHRFLP